MEEIINLYKEELLKNRYRFNTGLIMGKVFTVRNKALNFLLAMQLFTLIILHAQGKQERSSSGLMGRLSRQKWTCRYMECDWGISVVIQMRC